MAILWFFVGVDFEQSKAIVLGVFEHVFVGIVREKTFGIVVDHMRLSRYQKYVFDIIPFMLRKHMKTILKLVLSL